MTSRGYAAAAAYRSSDASEARPDRRRTKNRWAAPYIGAGRAPIRALGLLVGEPDARVARRDDGEPGGPGPFPWRADDPRRVLGPFRGGQHPVRDVGEAIVQACPPVGGEPVLDGVADQDVGEAVPAGDRAQQPGRHGRGEGRVGDGLVREIEEVRQQVGRDVAPDHGPGGERVAGASGQPVGPRLDGRGDGGRHRGRVGQPQAYRRTPRHRRRREPRPVSRPRQHVRARRRPG
ncbi:hypothetical protein PSD17_14930 [Pseudonocardia sp. D17]|nr:hypothetical protein PSD17_14930 [Pseudonocardia sp. D17]